MPLSKESPKTKLQFEKNANLSNYTTFQLGGECPALYSCETPEQLQKTIKKLVEENASFILIGGGSNIVVSDKGVNCHVIRYVSEKPLIEQNGNELSVSASTSLDALVSFAAENSLEGINYCSGIPGTVGGAIVGNAGAFGKQIGDVLKDIIVLDRQGNRKKVLPGALFFRYRSSALKETEDIVVSARLELKAGDSQALLKEREEILKVRREKHPDLSKEPCAGSFFRNIEPTSKAEKRQAAGWFLDQAGGKKLKHGGAYVYEKHANIIIKGENCTAEDVYHLHKKMADLAKQKFDLDLVREVKFVGEFAEKTEKEKMIW